MCVVAFKQDRLLFPVSYSRYLRSRPDQGVFFSISLPIWACARFFCLSCVLLGPVARPLVRGSFPFGLLVMSRLSLSVLALGRSLCQCKNLRESGAGASVSLPHFCVFWRGRLGRSTRTVCLRTTAGRENAIQRNYRAQMGWIKLLAQMGCMKDWPNYGML